MLARDDGQSTPEWIGLLLVVVVAFGALASLAGVALPGAVIAEAIAGRIVCALDLGGECGVPAPTALAGAYGDELAALVSTTAPQIRYERGMRALPVDFRNCRRDECAEGRDGIRVARSLTGEPAALFTRVIDCSRPGAAEPGVDCDGEAAGMRYVQYWLYYPGSATAEGSTFLRGAIRSVSERLGHPTYHADDWESVQFRVDPGGVAEVRASSHHGYGSGWAPADEAAYTVSGGSHAGTIEPAEFARLTNPRRLGLIPLEPIAAADPGTEFAVTPPWLKRVWADPEYEGTD